ncbi:hypothetical protein ACFS4T_03145 [Pseudomonas lini]
MNGKEVDEAGEIHVDHAHQCFLEFAESILPQSVLRASITAAYRRPEPEVVPMLIEQARLPATMAEATNKLAASIAEKLRNQKKRRRPCRDCSGSVAGIFSVVPGRRSTDVPRRSAAAHPGQRDS